MAEKKTYRIQGTVTLGEREEYIKIKERYEEEEFQGMKLTDGQFIMLLAKRWSLMKKD
ncbi:Uncharacterised protein [Streptococcus pneumoniae]|nr:Uncharacterised protein [Streptococcus pneumoniae]VPQ38531.1 Uncharacterised protein [Streptococcus pneumoniae]